MANDSHPAAGDPERGKYAAYEASFVGRDSEIARLVAALHETIDTGRPRFLVVEGEPGIGKSRLVRELGAIARASAPGSTILQGHCLPGGPGVSNWAPAEMLRRAFGIGSDLPTGELDAAFVGAVARAVEPLGLSQRDVVRTAQALATSAGILLPGNAYDRAEPRDVQAAILRAWSRLFDAYARRGSTLVLLEDIQWAGAGLRTLIAGLVPTLVGPVFHVVTTRPGLQEQHPGLLVGPGIEWVSLAPLSNDESEALVSGLLGGPALGAELSATIIARAEGNPFFIEETIRHLIETGVLRREEGGWRVGSDRASGAVPVSLASVLTARIEALPLDERRVLQEASVAGATFWEGMLRHVLGDARIRARLERLSERGLITFRTETSLPGQAQWQFKHELIRDAAYGTMSARRRARSHAAIAAWLTALTPDLVDEVAEMVATHEQTAVELDDGGAWQPAERELIRSTAIRHLLYAGDRARHRSALDRAVELHEAALRIATTETEHARGLAALAQDHEFGLAGIPALELYRQARLAARRAGLPDDERARICIGTGRLLALRWGGFPVRQDPAELDEAVEEGLRLANDPESRAWLLALKAAAGLRWSGWAPPDPLPIDDRLTAAAAALDAADRVGAPNLAGIVLHVRGYLQHDAGRYVEALPTLQSLAELVEDIESPYLRALSSMWISLAFADQAGNYAEALTHARRSLEIGRTRTPHERMHGTMGVMWCAYHLGDWATVHDLLDEHLTALSTMSPSCCPYVRAGPMVGALALAQGGDVDRARRLAGQVEPDLTEPGLPEALLARVLVATSDPGGGARLARSMVDGGRRPSLEQNDHETHALIEAMLAIEDWDGLRDILPSARRRARALAILGPTCDRAEAIALVASGSPDQAVPLLRRAADWFGRSRVPFELARTMTLLAPLVPDGDRLLAEAVVTAEPLLDTSHAEVRAAALPPSTGELSPRELEILALVADGRDNGEIAASLVLSQRTVERHVSNIYLKLGLEGRTSRAAAVAWALRHGVNTSSP
jgi:DNA-binding NarL/FixJ family response regulator